MDILIVSPSFPTPKTIDFIFVDQLCRALAELGHKVVVIAPQSVTKCLVRRIPIMPRHSQYKTEKGAVIELYRPYMVSLSNSRFAKLFKNSFKNAVGRAFRKMKRKPDVCYGHFWSSIFSLYPCAKEERIPLFGASGEENVGYYVHMNDSYKEELRRYMSGVISVSSKNQQECFDLRLVDKEKSVVIPNAINQKLFCKMDKGECRKELGIKDEDFVVAFVGQFVPRKGTLRLNDALKRIGDSHIKAVFVGSGSDNPDYEGIIYKGLMAHDTIPKWLNASDVFVLPTENEGCCNAIIEALACGLPVISTDAPFNYDILNERNSIMINCHSIDAIVDSILRLKSDKEMLKKLSEGALVTAAGLYIEKRAARIVSFIQSKIAK